MRGYYDDDFRSRQRGASGDHLGATVVNPTVVEVQELGSDVVAALQAQMMHAHARSVREQARG
jgi:hypothetical protein